MVGFRVAISTNRWAWNGQPLFEIKKPLSNAHSAVSGGIHQGNGLPKAKFILHREFVEIFQMILSRFCQNTYNTQIVLVNRNISSGSFYLCYFGSNLWEKPDKWNPPSPIDMRS